MAGRDPKKLEQVRADLARINPACKDVPILTADALDKPAVSRVAAQAEVVLSTAGPFAKYGDNLVEAAVAEGTHYADITGEVTWVKRSIQRNHKQAAAKGVRVLHCCGFDSVPSDLGAYMMVEHCKEKLGVGVSQVYGLLAGGKGGGISGGTIESGAVMMATETSAELSAVANNAYYLAEAHGLPGGPDKPAGILPRYIAPAKVWGGPWFMEGVNGKVVHESAALMQATYPYGKDFKYYEGVACSGLLGASLLTGITAMIGITFGIPPLRSVVRRLLPAPGQGPDEAARKNAAWRMDLVAVTDEPQPRVVKGHCGDPARDAGYWSTSRMLLETGLAMALEGARLRADARLAQAGVLSPGAALGPVLVERLRGAGFQWEVESVQPL
ncbi:hypothetical protein HYH03_000432 [Edaphochlamys debaryana]|uniref:Saccharopine dehydrogenase n=1 Tax=Edaphochlamys debaryana TaxID=47281 RepID=A0A835YQD1_9CHLO|nr:hypothetical protein HYH03_000432 [Edaphochlamys debaryana]|eukprot:KAG2501934.1 hypothetical protein HYH03_000432 [Edaphochlamys debaryana]